LPPQLVQPSFSQAFAQSATVPITIVPSAIVNVGSASELTARLELSRRLATATRAEVESMIDTAAAISDPARRRAELSQLLNRLAAEDFDAALHRAAALPGGLDRDVLSAILARGGTREQLIAVLDQAATTVDPTRRNELLSVT